MLIRQLEYLVALAAEKHFARAAERCAIAQPSLSLALRQLEDELGVPIVERGNRFRGFTHEGEVVLRWARRILADAQTMHAELGALRGTLAGRLRIGVIPSAIAATARPIAAFARAHPQIAVDEAEMASADILRELAEFALDAGITYVENEPLGHVRMRRMYDETYIVVTPVAGIVSDNGTATWHDVATLPLCLLRRDMQNRRIIEHVFSGLGLQPQIGIEASSMIGQFSYLETGVYSSILPASFATWLRALPHLNVAALIDPVVTNAVGVVVADRTPLSPLIAAFCEALVAQPGGTRAVTLEPERKHVPMPR